MLSPFPGLAVGGYYIRTFKGRLRFLHFCDIVLPTETHKKGTKMDAEIPFEGTEFPEKEFVAFLEKHLQVDISEVTAQVYVDTFEDGDGKGCKNVYNFVFVVQAFSPGAYEQDMTPYWAKRMHVASCVATKIAVDYATELIKEETETGPIQKAKLND
jgi:hypothetical protein